MQVLMPTCSLTEDGERISLLEDKPVETMKETIDRSMQKLSVCSDCFEQLYDAKSSWDCTANCKELEQALTSESS